MDEFVEYFSQLRLIPGLDPNAMSVWTVHGGRICFLLMQQGTR